MSNPIRLFDNADERCTPVGLQLSMMSDRLTREIVDAGVAEDVSMRDLEILTLQHLSGHIARAILMRRRKVEAAASAAAYSSDTCTAVIEVDEHGRAVVTEDGRVIGKQG